MEGLVEGLVEELAGWRVGGLEGARRTYRNFPDEATSSAGKEWPPIVNTSSFLACTIPGRQHGLSAMSATFSCSAVVRWWGWWGWWSGWMVGAIGWFY